jgi:hypothetical protein
MKYIITDNIIELNGTVDGDRHLRLIRLDLTHRHSGHSAIFRVSTLKGATD